MFPEIKECDNHFCYNNASVNYKLRDQSKFIHHLCWAMKHIGDYEAGSFEDLILLCFSELCYLKEKN